MSNIPPTPTPTPRPKKALTGALIAILAVVALIGAAFLGMASTKGQIKTAESDAATARSDASSAQDDLEAAQADLDGVTEALEAAEDTLEACDADRALEVFTDLLDAQGEILDQYSAYLDNDVTIFIIDFDAIEGLDEYNGNDSMDDQFRSALEACITGPGVNS